MLTCIAFLSRKTGRPRLLLLFLLPAVHRTIFPLPPRWLVALRRPLARVWGVPAAGRRRVLAAQWTYRGTRTRTHPAHVSAAVSKNILPPVIPKMINNHRKCCVFARKQLKLVPFTRRRGVNKAARLYMCATQTRWLTTELLVLFFLLNDHAKAANIFLKNTAGVTYSSSPVVPRRPPRSASPSCTEIPANSQYKMRNLSISALCRPASFPLPSLWTET